MISKLMDAVLVIMIIMAVLGFTLTVKGLIAP